MVEISEPNRSRDEENQKFMYLWTVGRSMAPWVRMTAGSRVLSSLAP